MSQLAIFGGEPVIKETLQPFNRIGSLEREAVLSVMDGGILSGYIGAPGPDFEGGVKVKQLEALWSDKFSTPYTVAMNSATSGLFAAMGASGIGPGDEVLVPPYTMSATAMAPLVYGARPVFVDIEADTFCINPSLAEKAITDKTRAIIAVNLFGHPAQLAQLRTLADSKGIYLIEDNAQAPLASEFGRLAGTVGHIGVFSLNRHKHIQTGEGGICATDNEELAIRLKLIRNHGENLVDYFGIKDTASIVGFNYRLGELAAAVGLAQLQRSDDIISEREAFGAQLSEGLGELGGLTPPVVRKNCRHVYYAWPLKFDAEVVGVSRNLFVRAMAAEGVPLNEGYVVPLYRLPIFSHKNGKSGSRTKLNLAATTVGQNPCPVTERMHRAEEVGFGICAFDLSEHLVNRIVDAFHKVYGARHKLLDL